MSLIVSAGRWSTGDGHEPVLYMPRCLESFLWLANLVSKGVESSFQRSRTTKCVANSSRPARTGGGRLDALKGMLNYAPITTPVMLKAAEFWATARRMGRPSADDASLDADMILVAQAAALGRDADETVIATTNAGGRTRRPPRSRGTAPQGC